MLRVVCVKPKEWKCEAGEKQMPSFSCLDNCKWAAQDNKD